MRERTAPFDSNIDGYGSRTPPTVDLVKDSDDAGASATGFWLEADPESRLATVQPYEGAGEFAIEDLTDEDGIGSSRYHASDGLQGRRTGERQLQHSRSRRSRM